MSSYKPRKEAIIWGCREIRRGQNRRVLPESVGSRDSNSREGGRKTISRLRRSTSRATESGCSPHRHFRTPCCSRGRCDGPLACRVEKHNRKRDRSISWIIPAAFVGEERDYASASMLSVKRNDIIRDHGVGRKHGDSKVVISDVYSQTSRSVWADALPHRHSHRPAHKSVGHTLIVYLSGSAKFMAMFGKMDGALEWAREGHRHSKVIYTFAIKASMESCWPIGGD